MQYSTLTPQNTARVLHYTLGDEEVCRALLWPLRIYKQGWNSVLQQRLKTVSQRELLSDIYDSPEKYIYIKITTSKLTISVSISSNVHKLLRVLKTLSDKRKNRKQQIPSRNSNSQQPLLPQLSPTPSAYPPKPCHLTHRSYTSP